MTLRRGIPDARDRRVAVVVEKSGGRRKCARMLEGLARRSHTYHAGRFAVCDEACLKMGTLRALFRSSGGSGAVSPRGLVPWVS